jgi:Protein of unknown function (DUF2442)
MEQAPKRKAEMIRHHDIEKILFRDDTMILTVDGKEYSFALKDISQKLAKASTAERAVHEISPSGYGIHWPLIDEDLSIDGLLGVTHHPGTPSAKMAV